MSTSSTRATALPAPWHVAAGGLVAWSRAGLVGIAVAAATWAYELRELPRLAPALAVGFALPALAAWLVERAFAVAVDLRGEHLVVRSRGRSVDVPLGAIVAVRAWRLPLPRPGLDVETRAGLRVGLGLRDPAALLLPLAAAGTAGARPALHAPATVYARARAALRPRFWRHPGVKLVGFSLLPALVFFRAHQVIAYGGPFAQWRYEGGAAYLATFAQYWATIAGLGLLYAALWRALAEAAAFAAACAAPSHASRVRRAAEAICTGAWYAGIPALVAIRFLA